MLEIGHQGDVAVVTMRHGKVNALDVEFCDAIATALGELERQGPAAVVVTGHGGVFSAGVDLKRIVSERAAYVERFLPALDRALTAFLEVSAPVVAAVNGHAIAGGCIIACACDRRLMAAGSGRIGVPELIVGVPFPITALEIVRAVVPHGIEACSYTGATWLPDEARTRGLVHEVVDADRLVATALEQARQLARIPRASFAVTKRLVRAPLRERIASSSALDREVARLWCDEATLDAVAAYVERTFTSSAPS